MQELIRRDPSAAPVVYEPGAQDIWIDEYLDEKETEVSRYVQIILKRKRLVASVALLVLAAAAAWTFTTERRYTSSVNLQIDPEQSVLPYRELYDAVMADPRYHRYAGASAQERGARSPCRDWRSIQPSVRTPSQAPPNGLRPT